LLYAIHDIVFLSSIYLSEVRFISVIRTYH